MYNLALHYSKSDRGDEGLKLYEEAFEISTKVLGVEDDLTRQIGEALARAYTNDGRSQAAGAVRRVLAGAESKVGGDK